VKKTAWRDDVADKHHVMLTAVESAINSLSHTRAAPRRRSSLTMLVRPQPRHRCRKLP
jgi:hypothetical protein